MSNTIEAEEPCPMCAIVSGSVASHAVYSDDQFLAVLDSRPAAEGHVLLMLKNHAHYLDELSPSTGHDLLATADRLIRAIRASDVPCQDVRMFLSDGEPEYKAAPHVHLHIFPRNRHENVDSERAATSEELAAIAVRIRRGVDATERKPPLPPTSPGHRSIFWPDQRQSDNDKAALS